MATPVPLFTVFTPTFNRADTLRRVYESLCSQTYRQFEWLVVDDGSTDATAALVDQLRRQADFPIRYFYQDHLGKHFAFNRAVREAQGDLLLNLDSDDRCVPTALERLLHHWQAIPEAQRGEYCSVTGLCADHQGRLVGDPFPRDVFIRYRYRVRGEKWGFVRTDVLRQYPFPEILPGQYVPECVVWSRIARRYKTRFVNEVLRIYHVDRPSLVRGHPAGTHAAGARLQHRTVLNEEIDCLRDAPVEFCRSAVHYARFSFHLGVALRHQWDELSNVPGRVLWLAFLPVAWIVYCRDQL